MKWHIVATVFAKELKETLRDRRTLFIMIALPVLLYPAMLVLLEQVTLFGQRSLEAGAVRVAVVGGEAGGAAAHLAHGGGIALVSADSVPLTALQHERLDAIVVLPNGDWDTGGTNRVELLYDGTRDRSSYARGVVAERLDAWADTLLARRLAAAGLPTSYAAPLAVADSSIATAEQMGGYALGRFLPMLLILMTVLGTFYPAIDLAAGEKERGTLEPLLATPVPADLIVVGKFAAAAVMGFLAALLNLTSMLLTFQSGIVQLGAAADFDFHLPPGAIAVILVMLALLSIFFASLFLGIAVRARSLKEAQYALTPV
jgi:sodium transport system permease protein